MLKIEIPSNYDNFQFSKRMKTKFGDYNGFVEEIERMIESGELKRMVEGMTEYHGGEKVMREEWNKKYLQALGYLEEESDDDT